MANSIHYEVFRRQGAKGGWTLLDVRDTRDAAIGLAQEMMASEKATGVKVVKETYNTETGDYLTLKIFEDGHNQMSLPRDAEDAPHALPCFKPDDLYSYHARTTIARLLRDFLARNRITTTELMHRADMLEMLEATGTVYQHAIQKVAVAQAASTKMPVQQIIKTLNDLVTKATARVYRDAKRDLFPAVTPGGFGKLAARCAPEADGAYIFNGAVAAYLSGASGWDDKLVRLLAILGEAPKEGPARQMIMASVDSIVAEMLNGAAALHELIGQRANLAGSLMSLVELFLGREQTSGGGEGLTGLTRHFAHDDLPEARTAIAGRITAEFKSVKRLCPDSLVDELTALRRIANCVVMGVGKYLSHEILVAAFTLRSKRLVSFETLSRHLQDAHTPDEKLDRLLFVEDNIIGAENKRQLAGFVMPILTGQIFENHFVYAKTPVAQRLARLASLQARVLRSGFQDRQKDEIAGLLDRVACEAEERAKLFETVLARAPTQAERAVTMLRLLTGGAVTEGRLAAKARETVLAQLAQPGFMGAYVAHTGKDNAEVTPDTAMAGLMDTLQKAGIDPEQGLKTIAA